MLCLLIYTQITLHPFLEFQAGEDLPVCLTVYIYISIILLLEYVNRC